MTLDEYRKQVLGKGKPKSGKGKPTKQAKGGATKRRSPFVASRQPNETEAEYNRVFLDGKGIYEGVTFHLEGGSKYTPDWVSFDETGRMVCVEVKGAFRFPSESRAVVAIRAAARQFPRVAFVWAKKERNGSWSIFDSPKEGGK